LSTGRFEFDYTKYISTKTEIAFQDFVAPSSAVYKKAPTPMTYRKEDGTIKSAYFNGSKLNTLKYFLEDLTYCSVAFENDKIIYSLFIPYVHTNEFRKTLDPNTESPDDIKIEENYYGIVFHSNSVEDILKLYPFISQRNRPQFIQKYFISRFNDLFNNFENIPEKLKTLYEQAPGFVLKERLDEKKIKDIETLLQFDKGDWIIDGWFKDSSNAMIKLLMAFNNLDTAYQFYFDNPAKLYQIYDFLNDNGKKMLCEILKTLIQSMRIKYPDAGISPIATYKIGKNYTVESDGNLHDGTYILLNQMVWVEDYNTFTGDYGKMEVDNSGFEKENPNDIGLIIPFAIVELIDEETRLSSFCPALYIKYLADTKRKEDLEEAALITLAILSILMSAGTLLAGSTALASTYGVFLVSDIALNGIFLIMKDEQIREEIRKLPGGDWFVENWDNIYLFTGGLMGSVLLGKGILESGPKLIKSLKFTTKSTMLEFRNFVMSAMITAVLEIKITNFVPRSLIYYEVPKQAFAASRYYLSYTNLVKLYRYEVYLLKGEIEINKIIKEGYALLYKGEIIASGTKEEIKKVIKEIVEAKDVNKAIARFKAFAKWASKFEERFHLHFDGEFKLKRIEGIQELEGTGGHNHLQIDKNIKIRRFLSSNLYDKPFDALISVRYKNGQWIEKQAKSSMFPKNWNIDRVKQEIALVYDEMINSGKFEQIKNYRNPQFKALDSTGKFEIIIEFDNLGNITNAYPKI
jgi:hypothetical protein